MKVPLKDVRARAQEAVLLIAAQFKGAELPPTDDIPEDLTLEELWEMYAKLKRELNNLKTPRRIGKPRVEDAVKLLLTDERFQDFSPALIASIVQKVFVYLGVEGCKCSARSVGWYISQKGKEWGILCRKKGVVDLSEDEGW